jgi:hypothetical protein
MDFQEALISQNREDLQISGAKIIKIYSDAIKLCQYSAKIYLQRAQVHF